MRTRVTAATALLALTGAVLHLSASAIPPPPLADPSRWAIWLADAGPIAAAFALLRLTAVAAWWYLLAAVTVGCAGRLAGLHGLVAVTDRLTVPALRRLLTMTVAGMTLTVASTPMAWATAPPVRAAQSEADPTDSTDRPVLTMTRLADTPGSGDGGKAPPRAGSIAAPRPAAAPPSPRQWTVAPGQSFWSIAESVVAGAGGDDREATQPPSEVEIGRYWLRLIKANRTALADRANPDLIFPGQVFTLPAPSP